MSFLYPTCIPQQQTGQLSALPQHDFSYQHGFTTPSAGSRQPHGPISVDQTSSAWTVQPQAIVSSQPPLMPHPEVQILKRQLDGALTRLCKYEDAIFHLIDCQSSHPLKTKHGIICPDCKQEVAHACSSLLSLITSSSLQLPVNRSEYQPSSANLTGAKTQENIFDRVTISEVSTSSTTPRSSNPYPCLPPYPPPLAVLQNRFLGPITHTQQLPLSSSGSDVFSVSASHSINHHSHPPPYPSSPHSPPLGIPVDLYSLENQENRFDERTTTASIRRLPPTPAAPSAFISHSSVTLGNPTGSRTHLTGSSMGNFYGDSSPSLRRLPPVSNSSDVLSASPSDSVIPYARPPNSVTLDHPSLAQLTGSTAGGDLYGQRSTARSSTYLRRLPRPPTPTSHSNNTYPPPPASNTLDNPTESRTPLTSSIAQENHFGERVAARLGSDPIKAPSPIRRLPPTPSESAISSVHTPHSTNSHPPASDTFSNPVGSQTQEKAFDERAARSSMSIRRLPATPSSIDTVSTSRSTRIDPYPRMSVTSQSKTTSSYPPTCTRDQDLHHKDFECEPKGKAISNWPENTNQQNKIHGPRCPITPKSRLPSSKDHVPLLANMASASEHVISPAESEPLRTPYGDRAVASRQESREDWSIRYNSKVNRSLDVTLVCSLHVEREIVNCLKFSKNGKYLAVGFRLHGTTNIYEVQTGEKICTLRDIIDGKDIAIEHICFSPDGLYLATVGSDDLVRVWEISKKYIRNVFRSSAEDVISCIDFSPDGRLIAAGTFCSGNLEIWKWRDGSQRVFEDLGSHVFDICFSANGQHIAAGVHSGDVLIWSVRTGQLVEKLMGHHEWVYSIAFTPDGLGLVSGSGDETVKCWDMSSLGRYGSGSKRWDGTTNLGKEILNVRGHNPSACFVAVSSNGRWVVSCSYEKVYVWNARNAELLCELGRHSRTGVPHFDFSPAGGCLASAFDEVLLWKIEEV